MQTFRRILPVLLAFLATAGPASAQDMGSSTGSGGLIYVWGWILVAGIFIMIVGTSVGVRGRR